MKKILSKLFERNKTKTPLGRWTVETCNKKINNKIDLANEDHCGPCGTKDFHLNTVHVHKK